MEYYVYQAKEKIQQLFENISEETIDKWLEETKEENTRGGSIEGGITLSNILDVFKGGIKLEKTKSVMTQKELKISDTKKLKKILHILKKEQAIKSFENAITTNNFKSIFYSYSGQFFVEHCIKDEKILEFHTKCKGEDLVLYISKSNVMMGRSSLFAMFNCFHPETTPRDLEVVFTMFNSENVFIGTPLYMMLH